MAKTIELKSTPTPGDAQDDLNIIINREIGDPNNPIKVLADLRYLMEDKDDYLAKLLDSRGIPQDQNNLSPNDPLIPIVLADPQYASMPERTRSEKDDKYRLVLNEVSAHYTKLATQAMADAFMLALTLDTVLTEDPVPYEPEVVRKRPGLLTLPSPVRNLSNPTERRLKQLYDALVKQPQAFNQLQEAVQYITVDVASRLQQVDKQGFRS